MRIVEHFKSAREKWLSRRRGYARTFLDDDGKLTMPASVVVADLASFCHVHETTAVADGNGRMDALAAAQLEGRRQVYIRVMRLLQLTDADIYRMTPDE